eukprot:TRINITY_DN26935_c0_g1_i1.p1 TRINITY_DN26935_c0_g1~~TRINITY_DN26935_c0_g1_i1.p1  ORF type:complete len:404 (+),score=61.33 TRINITY_DN26935_c0_g1_i1:64-1212(+)
MTSGSGLYAGKKVLAPMVRVGTLPFRLLAAEFGAELTYTEEIVDCKLQNTERRINPTNGTIEYVHVDHRQKRKGTDGFVETLVFSTLPREQRRVPVILQLGTASGATALAAARHVAGDVDGIDVNMGCPKKFSLQGGMGSALLHEPERVREILTTLVDGLRPLPVTCKIRILEDRAATVALLRVILSCGVSAVGIHPRTPGARTETTPADYGAMRAILAEMGEVPVPVILSGDVLTLDQFEPALRASGACSAMLARGALRNPTVFSSTPLHPVVAARKYLEYCDKYTNNFSHTKYTLTRMFECLRDYRALHHDLLLVHTPEEALAAILTAATSLKLIPGGPDQDVAGTEVKKDCDIAEESLPVKRQRIESAPEVADSVQSGA